MLKINHIGIVVENIESYLENAIYSKTKKVVFDSAQNSRIALIETSKNESYIELIEPVDQNATTYNFLVKTGGGLHHVCYDIDSEEEMDILLKEKHIKKIHGPVKAVLFDNRKVVFGYTRNKEIVEFLILSK